MSRQKSDQMLHFQKSEWETEFACLKSFFYGFKTFFLKNILLFNTGSVITYHCCDLKLSRVVSPCEYKTKKVDISQKRISHQTVLLQGEMRHPETTNHANVKNLLFWGRKMMQYRVQRQYKDSWLKILSHQTFICWMQDFSVSVLLWRKIYLRRIFAWGWGLVCILGSSSEALIC